MSKARQKRARARGWRQGQRFRSAPTTRGVPPFRERPPSRMRLPLGVSAAGLASLGLALGMAPSSSAAVQSGTTTTGTAARTVRAVTAAARGNPDCGNKNLYPFGCPPAKPGYRVPPPPQDASLVPTYTTKTTTRIWGTNPYQEAVSVTQHLWPAVIPENAPTENNNVPDRPWGLTLVTPDDPVTAISAVPLIHFPDDAPILYVNSNGIPAVTLHEIQRLGDTGISRFNNVDAFLIGAAANSGVESQLKSLGLKYYAITAPNVYELANKIDQVYGRIQNPDTGVPQMETSASTGGNGAEDVMIGAVNAYQYILPATHWASHMPAGLFWVRKTGPLPAPTVAALKRRDGKAKIYVWGGPDQVSPQVVKELDAYGAVTRITNDDNVAFNAPPTDNPIDTAIAFAKMYDPAGMVGWSILGPGHGFTLVNENDWQGAVASAPLSHMGFHAPLLLTNSSTKLPPGVEKYLEQVAPTFLDSPGEGPYNMTYVVGDYSQINWLEQARVDYISEMSNRRVYSQTTGGRYSDSGQP
jgi:hypothetical protein